MASRDHYVSQFHLRGFIDPASAASRDPWLWVANCKKGTVQRRSPKKLGWSRDLFGGPGGLADRSMTIESFLAREVEGPAATALREFAAGEGPPRSDMGSEVWRYLAWAAARSLPMRALWEAWGDALPQKKSEWRVVEPPPLGFELSSDPGLISSMEHPIHGIRENVPGERFEELWDEGWRPRLSKEEFLQIVHLSAWYFEVRVFQRLKWLWARGPAGSSFVIGDRPVVWGLGDDLQARPSAFRHPEVQFVAPLSRSLALIGHHPSATAPETIFPSDINRTIASAAHEWIAGPTEAVVREALSHRIYH